MVLLAYVHGAKMLKGCHAPLFSRNYFSELPKNQYLTVLDKNKCQSQEIEAAGWFLLLNEREVAH